jgi:polyisoprenoid-binding protein YceI
MAVADRMKAKPEESMHSIRFTLRASALLFAFANAACMTGFAEQTEVVRFDPASTAVTFTLGDVLHTVHGTFRLKSGEIRFDPVTGAAGGSLVVDAASGDSGNRTRDRKMKRDILQTDQYPEIVFSPTHVTGSLPARGEATLNVQGLFRIHGADHQLTLSVPVVVSGIDINVRTEFLVPYVAWGMKNPSSFILRVNDKVQIDVAGTAHVENAPQSASVR